jgi:signal transduction histidine kinase
MMAVAILTILVLVLAELALIRASLSPMESLAKDIAALDVTRPGRRLTSRGIPRDFQPIVDRLNDMVARVEQAFARERKFAADFSHEIRTPLAGLRTTLEVGLLQTRTPEEYQRALRECLSMSAGMEKLTETMLTLKRIEEGGADLDEQPVEAAGLVAEILAGLSERISRRNVALEVSVPPELRFTTNRALFALALRNVLDNAVSHGDAGGRIWVRGGRMAGESFLEVANSGCSLSQDQAESLRARFRRGDSNRDANTGHAGLGLAVVDELAQVLGFSVSIHAGGGGIYRLRFTQSSPERG